ncbi:MAG: hypothetical protein WBM27_04735, partial [bacterium]
MKRLLILMTVWAFLAGGLSYAQNPDQTEFLVLYNNGPLVTTPGGGAGGHDISEVQTNLSMSLYGFGNQFANNNRMTDDFAIPAGETWNIE